MNKMMKMLSRIAGAVFAVSFALILAACATPDYDDLDDYDSDRYTPTFATQRAKWKAEFEALAEEERRDGFRQNMGFDRGDLAQKLKYYSDAVIENYKEMYYQFCFVPSEKQDHVFEAMMEYLENIIYDYPERKEGYDEITSTACALANMSIMQWEGAAMYLAKIEPHDERDSFYKWCCMIVEMHTQMVSTENARGFLANYEAFEQRHKNLPAYWYFKSDINVLIGDEKNALEAVAALYNAIDIAPNGRYSSMSRKRLAKLYGFQEEQSEWLLTRREIVRLLSKVEDEKNPQYLAKLLPLLSLEDFDANVFTVNFLHKLLEFDDLHFIAEYLKNERDKASGILRENLDYILTGFEAV